ncbi:MAG: hypothetical protein RBG13Loki_2978 [Promethearchaeota archaeon CR_4]|nr:MAG: hypothetical protein RBG13Loki_2978 [Candidatus Lokiarchaeota archaeon CR_4]
MLNVDDLPSLSVASKDKGLAQVGDALVNFIYSIARSQVLGKRTGKKVNRTILSEALKNADLRYLASPRANAHDLADTVEAIVAYAWVKKILPIEEMILILAKNLNLGKTEARNITEENFQAAEAFKCLLEAIQDNIL